MVRLVCYFVGQPLPIVFVRFVSFSYVKENRSRLVRQQIRLHKKPGAALTSSRKALRTASLFRSASGRRRLMRSSMAAASPNPPPTGAVRRWAPARPPAGLLPGLGKHVSGGSYATRAWPEVKKRRRQGRSMGVRNQRNVADLLAGPAWSPEEERRRQAGVVRDIQQCQAA